MDLDLPKYYKTENDYEICWFKNEKLHRDDDLPAYIGKKYGTYIWYKDDKIHRDNDKPAWTHVLTNGFLRQDWYIHGKLHRTDDKPASILPYEQRWYKLGKLHRTKGKPAITHILTGPEWYVNGIKYTKDQVKAVEKVGTWYKRMKQRQFILLVWRVMTPIYFHPSEIGGKKAIKALQEYDKDMLV